jgi:hypothetical protein
MTEYLGLDRGDATVVAAEHWLRALVDDLGRASGIVACTHLVRVPTPHVAVSLALPGSVAATAATLPAPPAEYAEAARIARAEHEAGTGGRAVDFPGRAAMTGVMTVAELLAAGAVERVTVLGGGGPPDPEAEVDTKGYVRPLWMDGRLTLVTQPAAGGRLAPFEVANPQGCCADH